MRELEYKLSFATPAFLGNADQSAQWRTPPFKAQLRQWWRMAYAADHEFRVDVKRVRHDEGILFGHAWLDEDRDKQGDRIPARRSSVRIRLSEWRKGTLAAWPNPDPPTAHPDVPKPVGSQLYLGWGPLVFRNGTALKSNAAIQAGEQATFSLAFPSEQASSIERALFLMDRFGTVGGRSRNGWGSFSLLPLEGTPGLTGGLPLRPWQDAVGLDWPHALGSDAKGALIWQTAQFDDWKELMKQLAVIKIGLRTQFSFTTGKNAPRTEPRHWLSYPVTNHSVAAWGSNARLPNSLRFKVRPAPNDPKKLVGVILHVPCLPPAGFSPDLGVIEHVWRQVHAFLDAPAQELTRIPA